MRNLTLTQTIAAILILLTSCRTANKLYNKGNYDEAFYKAVKSTTSAKSYQKNSTLINNSYTNAVDNYKEEIVTLNNYNSDYNYSKKISIYEKIEALNNTANKNVFVRGSFTTYDVTGLIADAKQSDINFRINKTEALIATNQKARLIEAYKYAQSSSYKYPTNNELQMLMQKAYDSGQSTVAVQISNRNNYNANYSYSQREALEQLERNVLYELNTKGKNNLITFVNATNHPVNNTKIDYLINLQMQYTDADFVRFNSTNKNVSKANVLVREVVIRSDSIIREYGTVNAIYITNQKYIDAKAQMNIEIRKAASYFNNYNRSFTENFKWATETYNYTGDIRALDNKEKESLNKQEERQPTKSSILIDLEKEAVNKASYEIINFLNQEFR